MIKRFFTLVALFAVCFGAKAEVVEDYFIDYATTTWNFYVMDYTPVNEDGVLKSSNPENPETGEFNAWYQYFVADGIPTMQGKDYKAIVKIKGSVAGTVNLNMGWGWGAGEKIEKTMDISTEWQEVEVLFPEVGGTPCNLVFQSGSYVGDIEWAWVKVVHETNESKPTTWIDILTNGDAEGQYGEVPCVYSKSVIGENANEVGPAEIVADGDNHAFICRAGAVEVKDDGSHAWANQFWIVAPQEFKEGDIFKLTFRYKASQDATTETQAHKEPSAYLHYEMLGNVSFSTDWKTFSKEITVNAKQSGMKSIAFNLNSGVQSATDFYLDDVKWQIMELEEGYFVAGDFNDWNLGEAVQMTYDEDNACYTAVVGTEDKPASSIKISTKRGNDNAFDSNLLKVSDEIVDDADTWVDYVAGYQKIALPAPGVWQVSVDPENNLANFTTNATFDGINTVDTTATAPVYYNLNGARVSKPANGLFIMKTGDAVRKVMVK